VISVRPTWNTEMPRGWQAGVRGRQSGRAAKPDVCPQSTREPDNPGAGYPRKLRGYPQHEPAPARPADHSRRLARLLAKTGPGRTGRADCDEARRAGRPVAAGRPAGGSTATGRGTSRRGLRRPGNRPGRPARRARRAAPLPEPGPVQATRSPGRGA
jgi:hypothetical protein